MRGGSRHYNQIIPLTDRTDYLSPMANNVGFALAAERLMGIAITPRCTVLRVVACEMSRVISHMVWLGTTAIDLGAFTPFLWAFQERERIYDLQEMWTGARLTTSVTRVGGMMADIPDAFVTGLRHFTETFPKTLQEIDRVLTRNAVWVGRTQTVGVRTREGAINRSRSGPRPRASGVACDLRRDKAYLDYETYDFDVPVGEHGDVYDRYLVRLEECHQSNRILQQALARLPDGPVNVDDPRVILPSKSRAMSDMEAMIYHFKQVMEGVKAPVGEAYVGIENPKGELGTYLVQGERGWISDRNMVEVGEVLGLTPAYVKGVVTFYTMYHQHPVGANFVQVCTTSPCNICGAEDVVKALLAHTGAKELGATSPDGKWTVIEVECLGACGFATPVLINDDFVESVTPERVPEIVRKYR